MLDRWLKRDHKTQLIAAAVSLVLAGLLYMVGLKMIFLIVSFGLFFIFFPLPAQVATKISRLFFVGLAYFSALQIAEVVQHVLVPQSRFEAVTIIFGLVTLGVVAIGQVCSGAVSWRKLKTWQGQDVAAIAAIVVSLLVFLPIFGGMNSIERIAQMGAGQAIDGTNHFVYIKEMMTSEHLDYRYGHYYPKGFHLSMAYLQDGFLGGNPTLGWRIDVLMFFVQYLCMIASLCFAAVYFIYALLKHTAWLTKLRSLYVGAFFGLVLTTFFVLPFMEHGFLSFYYVCAAILAGFTLLIYGDNKWLSIAVYLLLAFGAGCSWPLMIPLLVAIAAVYSYETKSWRELRKVPLAAKLLLAGLLLVQFVPIVFQLMYSASDASQGVNLTGDLRHFRVMNILLALGVCIGLIMLLKDKVRGQVFFSVMAPTIAFVAALGAMQYILLGEVRYYAIKSAFLLELMTLCGLFVICLIYSERFFNREGALRVAAILMIPLLVFTATIAVTEPPFNDIRNLFRTATNQVKPQHFDQDISIYTRLGSEGKIKNFNTTLLHYNPSDGKFYAHMQIAFWANAMGYDASAFAWERLKCAGQLYYNLGFGNYTPNEQKQLLEKIQECAGHFDTYYIVTDPASVEQIRSVAPKNATIVSE